MKKQQIYFTFFMVNNFLLFQCPVICSLFNTALGFSQAMQSIIVKYNYGNFLKNDKS